MTGLWAWIKSLFRKQVPAVKTATPEPSGTPRKPGEYEHTAFTLRHDILDQLRLYFPALKRMRTADHFAFNLLSKSGIWLCPNDDALIRIRGGTSVWWNQQRPTFGAVGFGFDSKSLTYEAKHKHFSPRFIYFTKFAPALAPPGIQRTNAGDVYLITVFWDDPEKGWSTPTQYPLAIAPNGDMSLLRTHIRQRNSVRVKHGKDRGRTFTIPVERWGVHDFFREWAGEHHEPVATYLINLFVMAATFVETCHHGMTEVRISKNSMCCTFNLEIKRTAYFFRDRDLVVNDSGNRQRIFHIVRPHIRANGTSVPMHFRGQRDFTWNGYHVQITVPGLHKRSLSELNDGAGDEEFAPTNGWADTDELARRIDKSYDDAAKLPNKQRQLRNMWYR